MQWDAFRIHAFDKAGLDTNTYPISAAKQNMPLEKEKKNI